MGLGLLSPRVHRGSLPFPGLEGAVVPAVRMLMGSLERGGGWGVGGGRGLHSNSSAAGVQKHGCP